LVNRCLHPTSGSIIIVSAIILKLLDMGGKQDIGGYDIQKQEICEAVELPLTHHELYKQIGIDPPNPPKEFCCMDLQKLAKPCLSRLLLIIQLLLSFVWLGQSLCKSILERSNPCDHCVCFLTVLPFLSFPCFEIESSSVSIYLWSL
jgi:hypothetical protein